MEPKYTPFHLKFTNFDVFGKAILSYHWSSNRGYHSMVLDIELMLEEEPIDAWTNEPLNLTSWLMQCGIHGANAPIETPTITCELGRAGRITYDGSWHLQDAWLDKEARMAYMRIELLDAEQYARHIEQDQAARGKIHTK